MFNIRCSIFSVLLALLLPSCIDGREELWIDAKGGGKAEFTYDIPASAAALHGGPAGVENLLSSLLDNHRETVFEVTQTGNRLKIHVALAFSSIDELRSLSASPKGEAVPSSFKNFFGTFDFNRSGRTIDITRTLEPGKAIPGARFIPASQLRDRRLLYIIHLPVPASGSNATKTENQSRTLIWDIPLATAIREPVVTRFQAVIPLPSWLIATVIGVAVALIAGISWKIRSIRKLRQSL